VVAWVLLKAGDKAEKTDVEGQAHLTAATQSHGSKAEKL